MVASIESSETVLAFAPRTAIVLVNWRSPEDSITCLGSLLSLAENDVAVILCDNGSGDGSVERIMAWAQIALPPHGLSASQLEAPVADAARPDTYLTVVQIGANLGYAAGNNVGLRLALALDSVEAVWLLNNDTEVEPDTLSAMLARVAEDRRIGICGSTLIYHGNRDRIQAVGGFYNLSAGAGEQLGNGLRRDNLPSRDAVETRMSYVSGASMLVTRAFINKVGLMREDYFLYFEELDWALRGQPEFRLAWAPNSIVYHKEGGSIGTAATSRPSDLSLYYNLVNRLRVARRFRTAAVPLTLARVSMISVRYLTRRDVAGARIAATAVLDFVTGKYRTGAWLSTHVKSRSVDRPNG